MRKVFMLTNGTISLEDGISVSCVPSVPSHRSPEITNQSGYSYQIQLWPEILSNQSGYSYQAQLQPAMLGKSCRKEKINREAPSILVWEYVPWWNRPAQNYLCLCFPNNRNLLDDNCAFFYKVSFLGEWKRKKIKHLNKSIFILTPKERKR